MYEYRIAYRFTNNDVEGFVGIGFDNKKAREHAIQKVKNKIECIENEAVFSDSRLITDSGSCTEQELKTIASDWNVSRLSKLV